MQPSLNRILAFTLFTAGCALAQNSQVPAAYQTTYTELQDHLNSFDSTVTSQWNGKSSNVLWSSELLAANANAGLQILKSTRGLMLEVAKLHSLGIRSVVVNMALPIANEDFYKFNGDPGDFQPMINAYANLATQIHSLGMKMIVESALMFPGVYSANSGFNLTGYYATLSDEQFVAARIKNILTIAQQVKPDYINLNSEPDTDLNISGGRTALYGSPAAYAGMAQTIISQLHAAGVTIPLGAGVGTWLDNGAASPWVSALLNAGIDFLDLHVFPVNFNCLTALITYTNMAEQAGKPVGIAEAWLLKESDSEFQDPPSGASVAGGETYYARDSYSFWMPLDQAFLADLQKFANWKHLIYVSPFWTRYFWAYLDYNAVANLPATQVTAEAAQASNAALAAGITTQTASGYRTLTGGILQIPAVSGADFMTTPVAPDSTISIFGSDLSTGTGTAVSLPLPTSLANTTATIQDSSGNQQPLPFFFVSPDQINAAIPSGVSNGIAIITFFGQGAVMAQSNVLVETVAPALFTANNNGQGAPLGQAVTLHADGAKTTVYLAMGTAVGNYTPAPIDLGGAGDQSVLQVYGTGIRGVPSLKNVSATIGSISVPVEYAGPCDPAHFFGLDQVNLALPHSLAGAGQVSLIINVNGVSTPPVTLDFK